MEKVVGEFDKCDECEALVDVYVEFHSKRGDIVKVCMNCLASGLTKRVPDAPKPFVNHCNPVNGVHAPFCNGDHSARR